MFLEIILKVVVVVFRSISALEVLSLGMANPNCKDVVKEGDRNHVILAWMYFLLIFIFMTTKHKNCALEALTMLMQYFVMLPPNLAKKLKWITLLMFVASQGAASVLTCTWNR